VISRCFSWLVLSSVLVLSLGDIAHADSRLSSASPSDDIISIALLHFDSTLADLESNTQLIERGVRLAANEGAQWIMTPELALTGYRFDLVIGTDWINAEVDPWRARLQQLSKQLEITLFLSHLEMDDEGRRFNTLFVLSKGDLIGRHHKINTIALSESWSTPGTSPTLVTVDDVKVGLLICADAWPTTHANNLAQRGADILLSSANWSPGEYGPGLTWEKRSQETQLPLIVNNRTGLEARAAGASIDMREAKSVYVAAGERSFEHQSAQSSVIILRWRRSDRQLIDARVIPWPAVADKPK